MHPSASEGDFYGTKDETLFAKVTRPLSKYLTQRQTPSLVDQSLRNLHCIRTVGAIRCREADGSLFADETLLKLRYKLIRAIRECSVTGPRGYRTYLDASSRIVEQLEAPLYIV